MKELHGTRVAHNRVGKNLTVVKGKNITGGREGGANVDKGVDHLLSCYSIPEHSIFWFISLSTLIKPERCDFSI